MTFFREIRASFVQRVQPGLHRFLHLAHEVAQYRSTVQQLRCRNRPCAWSPSARMGDHVNDMAHEVRGTDSPAHANSCGRERFRCGVGEDSEWPHVPAQSDWIYVLDAAKREHPIHLIVK